MAESLRAFSYFKASHIADRGGIAYSRQAKLYPGRGWSWGVYRIFCLALFNTE